MAVEVAGVMWRYELQNVETFGAQLFLTCEQLGVAGWGRAATTPRTKARARNCILIRTRPERDSG